MKHSFSEKANLSKHPLTKQLFNIIAQKQTVLGLSADIEDKQKFLIMLDLLGPKLCLVKTHVDIINDVDQAFIRDLVALSKKHNFLIFEDRKFADIGAIAKKQYSGGVYKIADWAHIVTVHALFGSGLIEGLKAVGLPKGRGVFVLAELSAQGNLIDDEYTAQAVELAQQHKNFVIGFISQKRLIDDDSFLCIMPGIHIAAASDALGQQYKTPEVAIQAGADIIIVGRGVTEASDPLATAEVYRKRAWDAYFS